MRSEVEERGCDQGDQQEQARVLFVEPSTMMKASSFDRQNGMKMNVFKMQGVYIFTHFQINYFTSYYEAYVTATRAKVRLEVML